MKSYLEKVTPTKPDSERGIDNEVEKTVNEDNTRAIINTTQSPGQARSRKHNSGRYPPIQSGVEVVDSGRSLSNELGRSSAIEWSEEDENKLIMSMAKSMENGIQIADDEHAETSLNSLTSIQPIVNDGGSPVLSFIRSNRTSRSRRRPSRRLSIIKEMSGSSCSDLSAVALRGKGHKKSDYSGDKGEKSIIAKAKEHSPDKNESIISPIDYSDSTFIEKTKQNNGQHTEEKVVDL